MKVVKGYIQYYDQAGMIFLIKRTQYKDQVGMKVFKRYPILWPGWYDNFIKRTQHEDQVGMEIF